MRIIKSNNSNYPKVKFDVCRGSLVDWTPKYTSFRTINIYFFKKLYIIILYKKDETQDN